VQRSQSIHGKSKLSFHNQIEFLFNTIRIRFRQSDEFIKFCVVGTSGVIVNLGIYVLLTRILKVPIEFASLIAIEISILSNFILNNMWTFKRRKTRAAFFRKLWRFHLVSGVAGLMNYSTLLLLVRVFSLWDIFAYLTGIAAGILVNYFLNSVWTWKIRQEESF